MTIHPPFVLTPTTLPDLQAWLDTLPTPLAAWAVEDGGDTRLDLAAEPLTKAGNNPHPGPGAVVTAVHLPGVPCNPDLLSGDLGFDRDADDGGLLPHLPLVQALQNALAAHSRGFCTGFTEKGANLWNHSVMGLVNTPFPEDADSDTRRRAYIAAVRPGLAEIAGRYRPDGSYAWPAMDA